MNSGSLRRYFSGVTAKKLSAVEADRQKSNQHEFNATADMKRLFGSERRQYADVPFLYLSDETETVAAKGKLTWYDARENHPTRSEYRVFYQCPDVMELVREGDSLFICFRDDGQVLVLIAAGESSIEAQLYWLFDMKADSRRFTVREIHEDDVRIAITANEVLETIGIEPLAETSDEWLNMLLQEFGGSFPATKTFSEFARRTVSGKTAAMHSADDILMEWLNQEEMLFRTYERYLIQGRLNQGFADVDTFISYSLSVQNRRKSRVGQALENHFEAILRQQHILYSRTPVTENHSRPDFIFPGIAEYHRTDFPECGLTMLGVKSTCKDRWRQVLAEADRVQHKHLLTLQAAISRNQTDQMTANHLQLVIPKSIRDSYDAQQISQIMTVDDFIRRVEKAQERYVYGH